MRSNKVKNFKSYLLIIFCIVNLFCIGKVYCKMHSNNLYTLDIYGTNKLSIDLIQLKYHSEFNRLAKIMQSPSEINSNGQMVADLFQKITVGIKSMGKFSFVNISPILYQNDKLTHFTIDIVDQNDKRRSFYFLPKPHRTIQDPDHLIATWMEYQNTGLSIFYKEKQFPSFASCPAHHCLYGFDRKELKKYKTIFDHLVEKDKSQLIDILRNDRDANKRATAAFLLAHIKSANELINILIPSIYDSNDEVRNNVMRVIGFTLLTAKGINVPISKIVPALDFPMTTDRNKALLIISSLVNNSTYAKYIIHHCSKELIAELKLQQPNVHGLAYMILKKVSGKNYSDRDYKSWEMWLKKNRI